MMGPVQLLDGPAWERLSWTLLNFLWQGIAIAAGVELALALLPLRRAAACYVLLVAGLLLMAVSPLVTFLVLGASDAKVMRPAGMGTEMASRPSAGPLPAPLPASQPAAAPQASPAAERSDSSWSALPSAAALTPYCLLVWLAGVVVMSGRLALGFFAVRGLLRSRRPPGGDLLDCAGRLGKRLGMASLPAVALSERLGEAIVVGLWRPVILLPLAWATETPPEVLTAVLAHELAHVRRWDLWVSLVQRVVETLLFYHPAVWWLSRRLSLERELCTDELAIAATGQRVAYAETLQWLGRRRLSCPAFRFAVTMGDKKMALLHRVRNVLGVAPSHRRPAWWPAGLLALMVPAAVWLSSFSPSRPDAAALQAAEKSDAKPAAAAENRIQPLDLLMIRVLGAMLDQPIDGLFLVEPDGQVALGPAYGRVNLKGLTVEEAELVIRKKLEEVLSKPDVQVTMAGRVSKWRQSKPPQAPYRISPGDPLMIRVLGTMLDQPVNGEFVVEPQGTVALGPAYGRAQVAGLTLGQAAVAIQRKLAEVLMKPDVSVSIGGWRSDAQLRAELETELRKTKTELEQIQQIRRDVEIMRMELSQKLRQVPAEPKPDPRAGSSGPRGAQPRGMQPRGRLPGGL
jgi:protein involved in polysaccharide export with SLBB domain/beta-lactamase regulating signal transducer with metallopeptidase domain